MKERAHLIPPILNAPCVSAGRVVKYSKIGRPALYAVSYSLYGRESALTKEKQQLGP